MTDLSRELWRALTDTNTGLEVRYTALERLLKLPGGFWDADTSLNTYVLGLATDRCKRSMRRGLGADLLDPEGVSQSVFVHLLMYPIPSKVEAQFWLKDVVRRETQEAVRNAGELLRSQSIETMAENGIVIPAPEPTHQDQRMSRKLARKLERRKVALQELVQRLTPALRRVASFQLFDGGLAMTAAGVGSQLKMRPNTVTQNWMRARVELQEMIIKSGMFRVRRKSVDK